MFIDGVPYGCGHRTCASTPDSCITQQRVNHSPLDCFRYVTFWINIEHSLLTVGVLIDRSRPVVFAQWSPSPVKPLSTMVRYVGIANERASLWFALYRDVDVNTCYVNETVAPITTVE